MDAPRIVPSDCHSVGADSPASSSQSGFYCCGGVDVPGVGLTHAHDCPRSGRRFALPGDAIETGMMPRTLGSQLLDGLLARLLFAAGDLARSRVRPRELLAMLAGTPIYSAACQECHYVSSGLDDPRQHTELCKTGRVLDLLAEILEVVPTPDSSILGKETAPAEETRMGEGVRLCGVEEMQCARCGAVGGDWEIEREKWKVAQCFGESLQPLRLNQIRIEAADGSGYLTYTHRCAAKGGE